MPRKKITPKEFSEVATGVRLSSHEKLCAERIKSLLKSIERLGIKFLNNIKNKFCLQTLINMV